RLRSDSVVPWRRVRRVARHAARTAGRRSRLRLRSYRYGRSQESRLAGPLQVRTDLLITGVSMRSLLCATAFALSFPLGAASARAQAPLKIAYVNTQALLAAAPGRAQAESLLTKEGDSYRAQLQVLQDSVNNMLAKYQKDEPTLTTAQKDSRQKAMQALEAELQAKNQQFQQQFAQHENEVMGPVTEQVRKVLDDIRAEDGYALILANDPQGSAIVAAD